MTESLGQLLRRWRQARGLSLRVLAERAQVGKSTLSYWEAGTFEPRLVELEATLTTLCVSPEERAQALALITAPRGEARRRALQNMPRLEAQLGPIPGNGDLLRALRHRKRWSLEQTAEQLRVSPGTLSRWEQGKTTPPQERLALLLPLLGALPQERAVLTSAQGWHTPLLRDEGRKFANLEARFRKFVPLTHLHKSATYSDLGFLTFTAEIWRLATKDIKARRLLAEVYANYASYLTVYDRKHEARVYAERALHLASETSVPVTSAVMAVIAAAHARVHCHQLSASGLRPAPRALREGMAILDTWQSPDMEAALRGWLLNNRAQYLAWDGGGELALALSEEACRAAEQSGSPLEVLLRRQGRAQLLLRIGRPREALAQIEELANDRITAEIALIGAEIRLTQGDTAAGQNWIAYALREIEDHDLTHLRLRARMIAQRLHALGH